MEFFKNHYEKVLLSAVLLGLAVAVALLPMKVATEPAIPSGVPPKEYEPAPITTNQAALQQLASVKPVELTGRHKLFNPAQWRKKLDGSLWKIINDNEVGLGAIRLMAASNRPLFFVVTVEGPQRSTGYQVGVVQEASKNLTERAKKTIVMNVGERNPAIGTLVRVEGDPANPALVFDLADGSGPVTVTKENPYRRIDGYSAEFRYDFDPPGPKYFRDRRVGDTLLFDGETNSVVDISSNYAVVASSSGRRATVRNSIAPQAP
ncbi:MAG TPA: hypothetical protein P5555_17665 [Candidatus Paceibacterota bacterium]|nr:hypothetical protein [Verrucomicrobiota bacterium]HRZ47008.1 hypothetical protein [Candidatus Paceibacterota bacterium]HRZ92878.1 hypothetical protein [Candidatus Paceibacterota bacterium]